jgi:hypothetical protein
MVVGEKAFGNRRQFSLGVDQGVKGLTALVRGGPDSTQAGTCLSLGRHDELVPCYE